MTPFRLLRRAPGPHPVEPTTAATVPAAVAATISFLRPPAPDDAGCTPEVLHYASRVVRGEDEWPRLLQACGGSSRLAGDAVQFALRCRRAEERLTRAGLGDAG